MKFGSGRAIIITMVRKLNAGDYAGACNELPRWVYAGGKILPGLVKRRAAEQELCLRGLG
ncbi:lysozyme [Undibacterium sp.]|uniref:lysozyme n=1 Tax=Undibacterium sp. TaxID=1914977 RepID=UPI002C6B2FF5|nr:glycoside hydrolase family protein [Undibacterium sp.]HTD03821.1 glycoside hydrolase family protein [Undibacterium sp.]